MLSLNDVKGIAVNRFAVKSPWKWDDLVGIIALVWIIAMGIALAVFAIDTTATAKPYVKYIIPQTIIEQGKDIEVTYQSYIGETVNGYVLKAPKRMPTNEDWRLICGQIMLAAFMVPVIFVMVWVFTRGYKMNRYVDKFVEKWAENKELPDM